MAPPVTERGQSGDLGASFVALGLPPLDRDAALAALDAQAPLAAEFNS